MISCKTRLRGLERTVQSPVMLLIDIVLDEEYNNLSTYRKKETNASQEILHSIWLGRYGL